MVQQWNPQSMKGLCPFHKESHPSFSFDRKDYTARCFSCGQTTDTIQALMDGEGLTFTQAAKKLFELAEIDVLWEKTYQDKAYRYPHEEGELTQDVIDYAAKRKISEATLRKCGVQSDGNGNTVFPYRDDNDVLLTVKYRPAHRITKGSGESKTWAQKGADTSQVLFNMNRCSPDYPLVICEGEFDCLAVYEAGYHNVVSIPSGATGLQFIDRCFDWLSQFEELILAGDNDEPGQKFNQQATTRLGAWRCKTVVFPDGRNDCNEVLYYDGKEALMSLIRDAHETPIPSVVDIMTVKAADLALMDGIETGIAPLDAALGKIYYSTITLVSGKAASGKSSLISSIICHCMDEGNVVFLYSAELNAATNRSWLDYIFAGPRHVLSSMSSKGTPFYRVESDVSDKISTHYGGKCFLYKDGASPNIDDLIRTSEDVVRRYDCKLLVFDNLMTITSGDEEELVSQKNIMTKLTAFAVKYNVAVILVLHLRKEAAGTTVTLDSLSGTAKLGNLAHRSITLERIRPDDKATPDALKNMDLKISILKDRMRGKTDVIGVWYDEMSRRFYTSPEELDYQYSWDKQHYDKPLVWPHDDNEEVFGKIERGA